MDKNIGSLLENEKYSDAYRAAYKMFLEGDYDHAHEVYDEIYERFCEKYGRSSEQAYIKMLTLANFEFEAGRYNDALRLYDFYLDYVSENYDIRMTNYYDVAANKAQILEYFGQFERAEELRHEILSACLEIYGEKSADTVRALGGLGIDLYMSGKYDEALEIFMQQYEMALNSEECDQNDQYPILQNIGRVYSDLNEHDKALEYLKKAYAISVSLHGEECHDSLSLLNDIAGVYSDTNKKEDVLAVKIKIYETARRVLGEENPDTVMAMQNLGREYNDSGDCKTAKKYIKPAFDWYEKNYGFNHNSTQIAAQNLVTVYSMDGQFDKAIELQEKLYNASLESLGKLHPMTIWRYIRLSYAYYNIRELVTALEISEDAVRMILTHPDSDAAKTCCVYAFSHCMLFNMKLEKYERTFELYDICCKLIRGNESESLYDLEMLYSVMAGALAQVGRSEESLCMADKSMEVTQALYGKDSREAYALDALRERAYILYKAGHLNDALETIKKAIAIQTQENISYPPLYEKTLLYVKILIELEKYDEAKAELEKTDEKHDKAEYYYICARLYMAQGDKARAAEMIRICLDASVDEEEHSHRIQKYKRLEKSIGA